MIDIGDKIKRRRMRLGLTQEELAARTELSKGFISQLERNLNSPSIATLVDILEALGTDLSDFFAAEAEEKVIFTRDDVFEKENEAGYTVAWLVPNAQKNAIEPILVSLQGGASTAQDDPHEGEEFGHVLLGTVVLHLGGRKFRVKHGESFSFKSAQPHFLHNPGKKEDKILWISTPPSF